MVPAPFAAGRPLMLLVDDTGGCVSVCVFRVGVPLKDKRELHLHQHINRTYASYTHITSSMFHTSYCRAHRR